MGTSIRLPNGTIRTYPMAPSVREVAESISPSLARKALAGSVDDRLVDLASRVSEGSTVRVVTLADVEGLHIYRHTAAHVLAQALRRLYPDVKLGIGPVIEDGFYYDVDLSYSLRSEDLPRVQEIMDDIVREDFPIVRREVTREEAMEFFADDPLKIELIRDLPADSVLSLYTQGEFTDLCRGPHLPTTGCLRAFQLLHVAGAYWRGDTSRPMLQRVYGVAFAKKRELEDYLHFREEAQRRDHRKLGRSLQLFLFVHEAPGMPIYLPKGLAIRAELEQMVRSFQVGMGYQEVRTPTLMHQSLWERSGHMKHYHDDMYFTESDGVPYVLKPMNCPAHMLIFKHQLRSYRDLPLRISEFGQVHRNELSGALGGLLRVRTFTQDDAHIFVREEQIEDEVRAVLSLVDKVYGVFGFSYEIELSTRPDSSMGESSLWERAECALLRSMKRGGVPYQIRDGEGAFYGPKIDIHVRDALRRRHQCATIQLDFQLPIQFDLAYVGEDNKLHRPVVIHRAICGSLDRFLAILIEHFGGEFPFWMAPVQAKVLSVAAPFMDYAREVTHHLQAAGFRVVADVREEKLGYKIREGEQQKVPFLLVVGENEVARKVVNVRQRQSRQQWACSLEHLMEGFRVLSEDRVLKWTKEFFE
ncbi:threonine--tRNA ligase [Pasteuria penetrans]|uniref:threonine--tRNA ligase n=1 Tax=Pasteuria penetrans TaxID=86005 RepID=UPI000F9D799C|nr:threonine--tRNA ligase [Pasteuria penetrans]